MMRRIKGWLRPTPAGRIGILLCLSWSICYWAAGGAGSEWEMIPPARFWWRAARGVDPTDGWLLGPIVLTTLFGIPYFLKWALHPFTRTGRFDAMSSNEMRREAAKLGLSYEEYVVREVHHSIGVPREETEEIIAQMRRATPPKL